MSGLPRHRTVLFYSLRRNQKTYLRIVTSSAVLLKLIPGVSAVLKSQFRWGTTEYCPVRALLEKQITSPAFRYLETSHKEAHYLFSIKYTSQDGIISLNTPTLVQGQREEEMP